MHLASFFCLINAIESLDNSLCLLSLMWLIVFPFVAPQQVVIISSLVGFRFISEHILNPLTMAVGLKDETQLSIIDSTATYVIENTPTLKREDRRDAAYIPRT